jgi:hypothetical protein
LFGVKFLKPIWLTVVAGAVLKRKPTVVAGVYRPSRKPTVVAGVACFYRGLLFLQEHPNNIFIA